MHKRTVETSTRPAHVRAIGRPTQYSLIPTTPGPIGPGTPPPPDVLKSADPDRQKVINELFSKEISETQKTAKDKVFREGKYSASYTTFAGCDVKFFLVPHLEAGSLEDYRREHVRRLVEGGRTYVLGEVQAISVVTRVATRTERRQKLNKTVSVGTLTSVLFDRSLSPRLSEGGDLVLQASNEYGDLSMMVLPDFKVVEYRWAVSIDDLVTEEEFDYEADEPLYWNWVEKRP